MAKKATTKSANKGRAGSAKKSRKAVAAVAKSFDGGNSSSKDGMGEAFIKLLQSPLVAELVAVAATAALASLAENGFTSSREASRGKRAGKAVKTAGKAAAAAVGRRLGAEIDEIRKAAKGGAAKA
ncbi:MAG TPA: hypothetical protein VHS33_03935 [Sphingomicrobium sp.]|jgi:hypothetical protein|nr:hypothetical protein [Sphingomicrobium sp.]